MTYDVVVVGGGWAGCSAALAASKLSLKVALLERADSLLGVGAAGGIIKNQARTTVSEEAVAMGGGDLFEAMERCIIHRNVQVPGQENLCSYNFYKIGAEVDRVMAGANVDIFFRALVNSAQVQDGRVVSVATTEGKTIAGKVFIDATGSAGPEELCREHGLGCVQCVLRCPTFGPRISLTALAGVQEGVGAISDNGRHGSMSGGSHLIKESLSPELIEELNTNGFILVPAEKAWEGFAMGFDIPPKYYVGKDMKENFMGVDIGALEFMGRPFVPLETLHAVKGFENGRFCEPLAGGIGHSIRFLVVAKTDRHFRVPEIENLYSCGEKVGPWVGKTEAVITGLVAGHNAGRRAREEQPFDVPVTTAMGFGLNYVHDRLAAGETNVRYGFSGGGLFQALKANGLYETDPEAIHQRVDTLGLIGVFAKI